MRCVVCGDPNTTAKARCHTCYEYRRLYGKDRSQRLVANLTRRDIEREYDRRYQRQR